jgi:hypothetical protein
VDDTPIKLEYHNEEELLEERLSYVDIEEEQSQKYYELWKKKKNDGVLDVGANYTWHKKILLDEDKKVKIYYDELGYGKEKENLDNKNLDDKNMDDKSLDDKN